MKHSLLAIALLLPLLTGCGSDSESTGAAPKSQKAEIEKWNTYVDLGYYLESDFNPAMTEYFRTVGSNRAYVSAEHTEYIADLLSKMLENDHLARELELALAKAARSDGDLDQATYEMGVQLKEVWSELLKARDYYAAGEYESDNYAQGREVHQRIYEAYMALESSQSRFSTMLAKEDAQRRQRDIEAMRAQGLTVRPAMLAIIDDGQKLQDALSRYSLSAGGLASLKAEEIDPLVRALGQSVAVYASSDEILNIKADGALEGLSGQTLADFGAQAQKALTAARNLLSPPPQRFDAPGAGEGGLEEKVEFFNQAQNSMIEIYNSGGASNR